MPYRQDLEIWCGNCRRLDRSCARIPWPIAYAACPDMPTHRTAARGLSSRNCRGGRSACIPALQSHPGCPWG